MPAAAAATGGFFSWARAIASANLTRTTGAGVWAASDGATSVNAATATAPGAMIAENILFSALAALGDCARTPTDALDDDIKNRNEREIQKRRRNHAAGHGGADRVARFASGT